MSDQDFRERMFSAIEDLKRTTERIENRTRRRQSRTRRGQGRTSEQEPK